MCQDVPPSCGPSFLARPSNTTPRSSIITLVVHVIAIVIAKLRKARTIRIFLDIFARRKLKPGLTSGLIKFCLLASKNAFFCEVAP